MAVVATRYWPTFKISAIPFDISRVSRQGVGWQPPLSPTPPALPRSPDREPGNLTLRRITRIRGLLLCRFFKGVGGGFWGVVSTTSRDVAARADFPSTKLFPENMRQPAIQPLGSSPRRCCFLGLIFIHLFFFFSSSRSLLQSSRAVANGLSAHLSSLASLRAPPFI